MLRILLTGISLLLSLSPSNGGDLVQLYKRALESCVDTNVSAYDDGVTSAAVVAHILAGICQRENQVFYVAATSDRSLAYKREVNKLVEEDVTALVLRHRATKMR